MTKPMHLKEAKYFPYLKGALVSYKVWHHATSRGGFSEREYVTGIVTDVKYKALGSGRIIYAIFHVTSGAGIDRVHHDDPNLRVMQLADGTTLPTGLISDEQCLERELARVWHEEQKRLLSGR